jgi:hypothetical protein
MDWLQLSVDDRKKIIDQISIQLKLLPQAIEKDWWVTMVLKALFSMPFALLIDRIDELNKRFRKISFE